MQDKSREPPFPNRGNVGGRREGVQPLPYIWRIAVMPREVRIRRRKGNGS